LLRRTSAAILCTGALMHISTAVALQERRRIRQHLAEAESVARARPVRLDPLRAATRTLLLDELARYRRRGRFPLNHDLRSRAVPEFIDSHGTRCAVAHLMDMSGQSALVRHIASISNNARVRELARWPELRAWLATSGINLEEAARIQPEYCFITEAQACFCKASGLSNLGLGTVLAIENTSVQIRVDRIDGELPRVRIGEQRSTAGPAEIGDQVLFSREQGAERVLRVGSELVIRDNTVRCLLNADTAERPIAIDTAFEALLAGQSACVNVLATDDSAWNQSQCSETEAPSDGGCGLAVPGIDGAGLTTAALLAALLRCRRRRRS
jgi:hypothetical protein